MLKGLRITFAFIALRIVIYGYFTGNREIMPYMFIFLGVMAFTIGLGEIKQDRKSSGIFAFLAGSGALFLSFSELFR
ncbi:YczI family protein [Bacillus pacificus]|uniref:YczI family protein n=1 Tax=Bacillus TaxID=1386 RepID=UPI00034DED58|nr:YczI family protein [Bacillus pacificus]MCC2415344.1 YczI family protein [Bacillus pacificus]MCC2473057.1 YczI family protein [Bacillus pacificus]MCU5005576.1 YczI family protein [Bacillus pacificus]MCU5255555.1 YczI family protein [Bacillus pacificus]MCU5559394.1 YczI family protein [Bacillus pacificus]